VPNRQSAPRKVILDSPDLLTMDEVAKVLELGSGALAHYHVRRAGIAVIRVGRVQAIRNGDLPPLAAAVASTRMRAANVRQGLSPDGALWGSRRTAEALGTSVRSLKRAAEKGEMPAVMQDGKWWWAPEFVTRRAAEMRHD